MTRIFEDDIELWMLDILKEKGFTFLSPESLDPDKSTALRVSYHEVVIESHVLAALQRINPSISGAVLQQAVKEILRVPGHGDLVSANQHFHILLTEGIDVTFMDKGEERTIKAKLIDEVNGSNNNWCVTHQLTIIENGQQKRPDVIIYLNGLPVIVVELKNPTDEAATVEKAYQQLQTYHKTIPTLFVYNCFEIISDGLEAKVGTITSDISRFMSWKTADGKTTASARLSELSVMMEGLMNAEVLTDMIQNFMVYEKFSTEDPKTKTVKVGVVKNMNVILIIEINI